MERNIFLSLMQAIAGKLNTRKFLASPQSFRGGTPRSGRGGRDKSYLPHGYPGAKLARAAIMGRITKHH